MHPEQHAAEAAKALPAITVTGLSLFGIPIQEWLILITIIYTVLQIYLLVRRMVVSRRITDKDPECAANCPVVARKK